MRDPEILLLAVAVLGTCGFAIGSLVAHGEIQSTWTVLVVVYALVAAYIGWGVLRDRLR